VSGDTLRVSARRAPAGYPRQWKGPGGARRGLHL